MSEKRKAILDAKDFRIEEVNVGDVWPAVGTVHVRSMNGTARDAYEAWCLDRHRNAGNSPVGARGLIAALTLCDAEGELMFTPADADALGQKSPAALDRILPVAMRLSGLTAEAVESAEKN